MSSRKTLRTAPQPGKEHVYVPALAQDNYGRMSLLTPTLAHGMACKKLDAASQRLQLRAESKAQRDDQRAYRIADNGLRLEFIAAERQRRSGYRAVKTKFQRDSVIRHKPPKERKRYWSFASEALPHYDSPVLDRRGQRGVFMRIRYYSRKTAKNGTSARVVHYIFHGAALDEVDRPYFVSNVGADIDEALCAFDHLEQINWAAQKNAKGLLHAILAADHRQTPDEMMRTGLRWAEECFGRFGLPYAIALHEPSPEGDERNWHYHVLFSFRPMERIGDHAWEVGEMLRSDLDNPQAMRVMREMYAAVLTEASIKAGHGQIYTAKSHAARGLVHEPQVHLGGALTSMARNGHHVAKNEENFERVMRSEAAALDEALRHMDEALVEEQQLVQRSVSRWACVPAIPPRVPQRIMASVMGADLPRITMPAPLAPVHAPMPAMAVPMRCEAAAILTPIPSYARPLAMAPIPAGQEAKSWPAVPVRSPLPATMAPIKIANLRFPMAPQTMSPIPARPASPPRSTSLGAIRIPALPAGIAGKVPDVPASLPVAPVRTLGVGAPPFIRYRPAPMAPSQVTVTLPQLPRQISAALATVPVLRRVVAPSAMAPVEGLGFMIGRIEDRLLIHARQDEDRARQEQAGQAALAKAADERQRQMALERLMQDIILHRRAIDRRNGKRQVEAAILARHKLVAEDLAAAAVQAQLDQIAQDRAAEAARMADVTMREDRPAPMVDARPAAVEGEEKPRAHRLRAWLDAAQRADRAASADDEVSWPRRQRGHEEGPAIKPVESKRSVPPPIMPRGRDL